MDLIGKTVRWEGRTGMAGHWYTARVCGTYDAEYDDWMVEVLDPGTREDLRVGARLYASADRITVIDSEPIADAPDGPHYRDRGFEVRHEGIRGFHYPPAEREVTE